jgi:hypothetical protein
MEETKNFKSHHETNINYVVTNPSPDTILRETDFVFVLAHEDPNEIRITEKDKMEILEEKSSGKYINMLSSTNPWV